METKQRVANGRQHQRVIPGTDCTLLKPPLLLPAHHTVALLKWKVDCRQPTLIGRERKIPVCRESAASGNQNRLSGLFSLFRRNNIDGSSIVDQ